MVKVMIMNIAMPFDWNGARARLLPVLAGLLLCLPGRAAETAVSARDSYNEGTQRLRQGKLREAESALQVAIASNEEKIQPAALHNLGLVRFAQGAEALKDAAKAPAVKARSDAAAEGADQAIHAAEQALANTEVMAIIRAYHQGKGAQKELKASLAAVKKAMETYGAVLSRWQRSSGDFKSAYELQAKLDDARFNGEVVDRQIAALIDKKEMVSVCMQCMNGKKNKLKDLMQQLKKRAPEGSIKDEDGEDGDEDEPPKEPKKGMAEKEKEENKALPLTWDEAVRLLDSLKLDGNRKLPMGDQQTGDPKDRKGKEW